jgi:hypothetical protein
MSNITASLPVAPETKWWFASLQAEMLILTPPQQLKTHSLMVPRKSWNVKVSIRVLSCVLEDDEPS